MKKLLIAVMSILLLAVGFNVLFGATNKSHRMEVGLSVATQDEKTKIKTEELPAPVKKTLEGTAYKDWKIASAYKLKNGDFEVELKKGDTTQALTFDKDGKAK